MHRTPAQDFEKIAIRFIRSGKNPNSIGMAKGGNLPGSLPEEQSLRSACQIISRA